MAEQTPQKKKGKQKASEIESTAALRTPAHAFHLDGGLQSGTEGPSGSATPISKSSVTIRSPKRVVEPLKEQHSSRKTVKGPEAVAEDHYFNADSILSSPTIILEDLNNRDGSITDQIMNSQVEGFDPIETKNQQTASPLAFISTVARTKVQPNALFDQGVGVMDSEQNGGTFLPEAAGSNEEEVLFHSQSIVGLVEEKKSSVGSSRANDSFSNNQKREQSASSNRTGKVGSSVYGEARRSTNSSLDGYSQEIVSDNLLAVAYTSVHAVKPSNAGYMPQKAGTASSSSQFTTYSKDGPSGSIGSPFSYPSADSWGQIPDDTVIPISGVPPPLSQPNADDSEDGDDDDAIYGLGPAAGTRTRETGCWSACFGSKGYCGSCWLVKKLRRCECDRVRSHCYFICYFMLYLAISSLARFLVFADALVHIILYSITVADEGLFSYLKKDLQNYTFEKSVADLLLLSLSRSFILFFAYAYRFHLSSLAILVSWMIMAFSVVYIVAKFITAYNSTFAPVLLFSLAICFFEWAIYVVVRRRRVTAPTNIQQSTSPMLSRGYLDDSMTPATKVADKFQSPAYSEKNDSRDQGNMTGNLSSPPVGHYSAPSATYSTSLASAVNAAAAASNSSPISTSLLRNDTDPLAPHQLADMNSLFVNIDGVDIHYRVVIHPDILAAYKQNQRMGGDQNETKAGEDREGNENELKEVKLDEVSERAKACANLPVLVLFHGLGGSTHSWDAILQAISPYCSMILAFDRPGAGLSSRPTRLPTPTQTSTGSTSSHVSAPVDGSTNISNVAPASLPTVSARFSHAQHELNVMSALGIPIFPIYEAIAQRYVPPSLACYFDAVDSDNLKTATDASIASGGVVITATGNEDVARLAAKTSWERTKALAEVEAEAVMKLGAGDNPYRSDFTLRIMFTILRQHGVTPSNCRNIVLLAHHSGAAHAIRCALACPRSISALIFASPNVFDDGIPSAIRSALRTRLGRGLVQQMLKTEIAAVALKRAWLDAAKVPPAVIQFLRHQSRIPGWQEAFVEMVGLPPETAPQSVLNQLESSANGNFSQRGTQQVMTAAAAQAIAQASMASSSSASSGSVAASKSSINAQSLVAFLGLIKCPVLILHGDQDRVVPLSASQKFARALDSSPSVSIATITRCGNVPHEESPIAFSEIVNDFMVQLTEARLRRFRTPSTSPSTLVSLPSQIPNATANAIASAASAASVSLPDLHPATVTRISASGVSVTVPKAGNSEALGSGYDNSYAASPRDHQTRANTLTSTSPLLSKARDRSEGLSFK